MPDNHRPFAVPLSIHPLFDSLTVCQHLLFLSLPGTEHSTLKDLTILGSWEETKRPCKALAELRASPNLEVLEGPLKAPQLIPRVLTMLAALTVLTCFS